MKDPEYMKIKATLVPKTFIDEYKLQDHIHNGYIYLKIIRGMYGLPQAGRLANKLLKKQLSKKGYYKTLTTPGLWKHTFRPIFFTLIVDDFGITYKKTS